MGQFILRSVCNNDSETQSERFLLDIEAKSSFFSIRADTAVFKELFYYEVTLKGDGLAQIGWSQLRTVFDNHNGVGDDIHSYAFDGNRVKKWNGKHETYGEQWATGDVIGTLIDLRHQEISFWRNKKFLGVAFSGIEVGENKAYFPAVSLEKGMRVVFNFGLYPFQQQLNQVVNAVNEPRCFVNNYYNSSAILVDAFRNFLLAFVMADFRSLAQEERLIVGSIILEYLTPMIEDDYVFESLLMQMFKKLLLQRKKDAIKVALQTFEAHYPTEQYRELIGKIVTVALKLLLRQQIGR